MGMWKLLLDCIALKILLREEWGSASYVLKFNRVMVKNHVQNTIQRDTKGFKKEISYQRSIPKIIGTDRQKPLLIHCNKPRYGTLTYKIHH